MLLIEVVDQLGDDLCVSVALELEPFVLEENLDHLVIGQDAVVDDQEGVLLVRTLGVGVYLARDAVGGPAGVSDAAVGIHGLLQVHVGIT